MQIFDEKEHAEKLLRSGFTSFMSGRDLRILAKYFKHMGKNRSQIEKDIFAFCEKHNPDFNAVIYDKTIKDIVKSAIKSSLKEPKIVKITKNELESIKTVNNYNKQKILFVMLVLAKNDGRTNSGKFFSNVIFTEILKYAKVNTNKEGWHKIAHELNRTGLIQATRKQTCQVTFVDFDSEPEIIVDNMKNIVSFFPFFCASCGKTLETKPKRRDVCDECYKKLRNEDVKNNMKKYRKNVIR